MSAALTSALEACLPPGRVSDVAAITPDPRRDLCRYSLGMPAAWVRPRSTGEVQAVVTVARERAVAVVPVGLRTAYWRPIAWEGAIALDTMGLDAVGDPVADHEPVWCGAGAMVRDLDERFRATGQVLPCHPDAFGDTSIGAMVATGFTSGAGMGVSGVDGIVAGLRVVLGTGEVLTTGTSAVLGHAPFIRQGLPDLTGALFAAEGGLGIVTEVAVRPWPQYQLARIQAHVGPELSSAIVAAASRLRAPGLYETLRAIVSAPPEGGDEALDLTVLVRSPLGGAEIEGRVAHVCAALADSLPGIALETHVPPRGVDAASPRWWGERGDAWRQMGQMQLAAVDVNTSYQAAPGCLPVFAEAARAARAAGAVSVRRALYTAPDHVNLGLHLVFPPGPEGERHVAHGLVDETIARLARFQVVPYRWGRHWGPALTERLDPTWRRLVGALREACDPDGILHPGATVFGAA